MRTMKILIGCALLALAAGCGESRLLPSAPGGGTAGLLGGAGNTGSGTTTPTNGCSICTTSPCTAELKHSVKIASVRTKVHVVVNVHYHANANARAEVFEMFLVHANVKYFFHASGACPVVPDPAGVNVVVRVDLGTVTGLPPGNYVLMVQHGVKDACFVATPGCDTSQPNWVVIESGQITVSG
jgi:hypothetical protein